MQIEICDQKRGPGVWKFNDSLINDETFCQKLEEVIVGCKRVYTYMHRAEFWELLKNQCIEFTRQFAREKCQNEKHERFNLYKIMSAIQGKIAEGGSTENLEKGLQSIKTELESYETQDAKRAAFRCKQNWYKSGEKPTKFFFNMEKRNFTRKTMYAARRNDGTLTKDYREILNIQYEFYEKLYTSDPNVAFSLTNRSGVVLSNMHKESLNQHFTKDELFDAVMTLKPGKCPGADGLSLKFYRRFWKLLVDPLYGALCQAVEDGELHPSARRGIINLIPKKNRDETQVKSWRPICLLNYDFKLYAKMIANRLETVSEFLIGKQQNGFIKGRSILGNIATTRGVISYLNKKNLPGVIAIIDFEKCFDRIEHNSIKSVFQYFNFGGSFINMLMLLYNNIELCTINNGFTSDFMVKGRGINQGCPGSPLVYSFCGEILNHLVKLNTHIQGVPMPELRNLLSQFADDTAAFLSYDQLSVDSFAEILRRVETEMGLKVSYEKTVLYRIGSIKNSNARLYTARNFAWSNDAIETLGVTLNSNGTVDRQNFTKVIEKLRQVCSIWYNRLLTLMGKVLVINTLMGSLFVYKMMSLGNMDNDQLEEAIKIIQEFLWNGKKARISYSTLIKRKDQGGLRLVDLQVKQKTLKIAKIFSLLDDIYFANEAYAALCPHIRTMIWECNLRSADAQTLFKDSDWKETLVAWAEINFKEPENKAEVRKQIIWWNSCVKIGGKPVAWSTWINKNIIFIEDLLEENGSFKRHDDLGVNWLEWESLTHSLPQLWYFLLEHGDETREPTSLYSKLKQLKKPTRRIYDTLINDSRVVSKYRERWREDDLIFPEENYQNSFLKLYSITNNTKLRDFQYRLLLNKLVTNKHLQQWGKRNDEMCTFCKTQSETVTHVLFECAEVQTIVSTIFSLCQASNILHNSTMEAWILNETQPNPKHVINFIVLHAKQYLYKQRCLGKMPSLQSWLNDLLYIKKIELFNSKREMRLCQFKQYWNPISEALSNITSA